MSIVYAMRTEGRARAVAKDLLKVGAEFGIEMKLAQAQRLSARLFGHEDWAAMRAALQPGAQGPEDHELGEIGLSQRVEAQTQALLEAGFAAGVCADVLSRLRPTARSGGAVEAMSKTASVTDHAVYHPCRLDDATWSFAEALDQDFWELDFWERSEMLAETVRSWYAAKPSFFADAVTRAQPELLENVLNQTHDFYEENLVIDASGCLSALPDAVPSDLVSCIAFGDDYLAQMEEEERTGITHYVHFGDGGFGSPWSDAQVEGVYLTFGFDFGVDDKPCLVEVSLIASDRSPPVRGDAPRLRNELRAYYHTMFFEEGFGLEEALHDLSLATDDPFEEMWAPYVVAPMVAALHAVAMYYRPEQRRVFAVAENTPPHIVALFDRAATFDQSRKAVQSGFGKPTICFLGDTAGVVPSRSFRLAGPGYEERPQLSDFEAAVDECFVMDTPEGYLLAAERALSIARDIKEAGDGDVVDKAAFLFIGAALSFDKIDLAGDAAREMVARYIDISDIGVEWRPLLSIALAVAGDLALAEELASFPVHEDDWHDRSGVGVEFLAVIDGLMSPD